MKAQSVARNPQPNVGVTEYLAAFIAGTRFEELPEGVVQLSKNSILDTIGVALAGAAEPGARILVQYVSRNGGNSASSLIGGNARSSPRNAALANGMFGWTFRSVPSARRTPAWCSCLNVSKQNCWCRR